MLRINAVKEVSREAEGAWVLELKDLINGALKACCLMKTLG